ncbi:unnamed protein product [Didymodactylos carnosus]|uniref:Uncharacterized protein n=1 Tax=Didymodactylos carnosus TaxID=1234261 RepID=A0A813WCL1_9BILA|nr:unnamed protein product [Didymodactylos carnosus]CAF1133323.1 unnamed protein product [Didymodactylos carnosus]CAF3641574.1 unnamed protein product [Didymodactylos carnosus]CAF3919247.1 unnamed protein product [Didymodactylos carnosus]
MMSVLKAIEAFENLYTNDDKSFSFSGVLVLNAIRQQNVLNYFKLLEPNASPATASQQNSLENQWKNEGENIEHFSIDSVLSQFIADSANSQQFSSHQLWFPFREDVEILYDVPEDGLIFQSIINNNNNNNQNDDDDTNYVDVNDDIDATQEEIQQQQQYVPKKKAKRNKLEEKRSAQSIDGGNDTINNTSTSKQTNNHKPLKFAKLSSKWSAGKRVSGAAAGTAGIKAKFRTSNDHPQQRPGSRLYQTKQNLQRLSQEEKENIARAVEERKLEERKRKVEKLHEQSKKREEVLQRGKQIQQDKEQKKQLRTSSDNLQAATNTVTQPKTVKQQVKYAQHNNSTLNGSMNDTTTGTGGAIAGATYTKTPYKLNNSGLNFDTTYQAAAASKKNKNTKTPANVAKKMINNPQQFNHPHGKQEDSTFVIGSKSHVFNETTLPSSTTMTLEMGAGDQNDWTILPTHENNDQTLTFDEGDTADGDDNGDYGLDDVRSDQDSDNEEEDESRIPLWAKKHLFQIFWKTQGHWYLSQRTFKLSRKTFGHHPHVKDNLQEWLKHLKSTKPLSQTLDDPSYLDSTQNQTPE